MCICIQVRYVYMHTQTYVHTTIFYFFETFRRPAVYMQEEEEFSVFAFFICWFMPTFLFFLVRWHMCAGNPLMLPRNTLPDVIAKDFKDKIPARCEMFLSVVAYSGVAYL